MAVALPNWLRHLDEEVDNRLLVRLRDGRTLIGILRSYDQYGNLLFEAACQRYSAYDEAKQCISYSDVYLGCVVVRGENIVLFGRMKPETEMNNEQQPPSCKMVEGSIDEVFRLIEINKQRQSTLPLSCNNSGLYKTGVVPSDIDLLNDEPFV